MELCLLRYAWDNRDEDMTELEITFWIVTFSLPLRWCHVMNDKWTQQQDTICVGIGICPCFFVIYPPIPRKVDFTARVFYFLIISVASKVPRDGA